MKKTLIGLLLGLTLISSSACSPKGNNMEILNGKDGLYAVLETEKGTITLNLFYKETPEDSIQNGSERGEDSVGVQ